jgi:hypothetical protein
VTLVAIRHLRENHYEITATFHVARDVMPRPGSTLELDEMGVVEVNDVKGPQIVAGLPSGEVVYILHVSRMQEQTGQIEA